jgi:Cu+-exporting ATPase
MNVEEATAVRADRDGKTFYFCSEKCREKFISGPADETAQDTSRGCCG